jgi:hypothetical protein
LPTPRHPPSDKGGAAQTSGKLTHKATKGRSSGQAGRTTLKSRGKLKQGALTTTIATAATPSAVSEGHGGVV